MRAVHQVHTPGRQRRAYSLRALHGAQMIGSHPGRERVAHDHVETSLARPVEDHAPIAHSDLDLG